MILLSGFAFYSLILNNIDSYNKSASEANASELNRNREELTISSIQITSENKLILNVENTGSVSSKLLWLGLFNQSVTPEWQRFFPLSEQIEPEETTNITSNDFTITQDQKYVVQITTEAGNSFSSASYPASEVNCALSLTVASPTTYAGNNVTVMLTVTLNDPDNYPKVDFVQNITASISAAPVNLVQLVGNSSLTALGLAQGESAFFWWIYNTTNTGTVTFNATYSLAPTGSYALTDVNILLGSGSVSITGIDGSVEYNPSQWNMLGATQNVSGSVADLASNDSNYTVFSSYVSAYSGPTTFGSTSAATNLPKDTLNNVILGTNFTCLFAGQAQTISAYIDINHMTSAKIKAAIYNASGGILFGSTEERVGPWSDSMQWIVFNFVTKPTLHANTQYVLAIWSDSAVNLEKGTDGAASTSVQADKTHGGSYSASWPSNTTGWNTNSAINYDIYCTYTPASEHTCGGEFTGSSNLQNWTILLWQIQSCWDLPQVTVTVQFYNFTLGNYASGGSGYFTYTSSTTANTNEQQSKTENSSPNDFKNSTGYWQVKITGVKSTNTPFLMKLDWIDIKTTYSNSDTLPYDTWQFYSIKATTTTGNPIPYAYVTIYTNGTTITMQNATYSPLNNPDYVHLDVNGAYVLRVNSAGAASETFMLYVVVGSVVVQKTVTQSAPQT